jgi:transcription initiation factor TFIIB
MGRNATATRTRHERTEQETTERPNENRSVCGECGGRLVKDSQHGERVCDDCGLVTEAGEIDHGPEWRGFDATERRERSRVGAPTTDRLHDKGLSTSIGWQDKDAYGKALSARKRQQVSRLRTWNERFRTQDSRQRNLRQALGEIDRMASALGLADTVRETASVIYRRALEDDLLLGRSIEGIATAAVFGATKQAGTPRTIDEVTAVSRIDETEFMRAYRYITQELGLEIAPATPTQYLPRFVSDLDLSGETERRARELLDAGEAAGVHSGRNPVGLAAAALYAGAMLANEKVTQERIAKVTDISTVTIRTRYKQLLEVEAEANAETATAV